MQVAAQLLEQALQAVVQHGECNQDPKPKSQDNREEEQSPQTPMTKSVVRIPTPGPPSSATAEKAKSQKRLKNTRRKEM
jgi:hypothetical protein